MEIIQTKQVSRPVLSRLQPLEIEDTVFTEVSKGTSSKKDYTSSKISPFIEANTSPVTLTDLRQDFIPVFSKYQK